MTASLIRSRSLFAQYLRLQSHVLTSLVSTATRMMAHGEDAHAFSAALAATERIEEPHARARALALAAGALSRAGDPQGALRVFSQALSTAASMNRDVIGRIAVLVDIAFGLAANGP